VDADIRLRPGLGTRPGCSHQEDLDRNPRRDSPRWWRRRTSAAIGLNRQGQREKRHPEQLQERNERRPTVREPERRRNRE
jgi:hypothetical protein